MNKVIQKFIAKPILALTIAGLTLSFGIAQANVALLTNPHKMEGIVTEYAPNKFIKITDENNHSMIFKLDVDTKYVPDKASIEEGDTVFVRGDKNDNNPRPTAKIVRKIKDKDGEGYGGYGGECTPSNVNRSLVTVKNNDFFTVVRNNITYKYLVTSQTTFQGGASNYAELEVGDYVEVEGRKCEGKKLPQAIKVFVAGNN